MPLIHENLAFVKSKVAEAAARAGGRADDVELIAVSKTFPAEAVMEAVEAGQVCFGENRVQELLTKRPLLPPEVRWHLIGHLQSNKIRKVLPCVVCIHSVDSVDLASSISRISMELDLTMPVLLEVNVAGEASKHGFTPEQLEMDMEALLNLPGVEVQGLMCVPPIAGEPEENRPHFVFLRELRDGLERRAGRKLPALSMGMSGDYEVAVEEGATLVRVGSAIFGGR